jgi:hypothetical protein
MTTMTMIMIKRIIMIKNELRNQPLFVLSVLLWVHFSAVVTNCHQTPGSSAIEYAVAPLAF